MEEEKDDISKIKYTYLQGRITKLEKQLEKLIRKIEIIERSLKK